MIVKILIVDVNYGTTSTGQIVFNLKNHFERKGHEVQVFYGRDSGQALQGAIKISNDLEVYAHAALSRLTGLNGIFSPIATAEFLKRIVEFEPDIVHLHELHGYYLNTSRVIRFLKENDIPTVWTFHCEIMYTGNCGYAYDCMKWKESCGGCPQLKEYPQTLYFDFTEKMLNTKRSDFNGFSSLKIISVSEWLAARVEESFLGGRGSGVVHNGIDTENIFKPRETDQLRKDLGITTDHIIVSIAPDIMSERKGGAWILEVAKRLQTQSVTFVLIGVKGNIENDSSNVICLPVTDDLDLLATYYSLGDYFLLTSKKETFSLTCVESLACGTPIIGFDCGAPTQIAPSGYGKFVKHGDLESLINLVLASLKNRSEFFSQRDCVKYAKEAYSLDTMGEAYLRVFQALLKRVDDQRLECLN